ncbi:cyclic nucleotide-binding domain-containing protein [Aquimarina rhabdastrellae]
MSYLTYKNLQFPSSLIKDIETSSILKSYNKEEIVVGLDSYQNSTGIIVEGLLKVLVKHNNNNLLLYHIDININPIISFVDFKINSSFTFELIAIKKSSIKWYNITKSRNWYHNYDIYKNTIHKAYAFQYSSIFKALKHTQTNSLQDKLYDYLITKSKVLNATQFPITNLEIAQDLNTTNNSISRAFKVLSEKNKIVKYTDTIKIL